ncbi:hypothetical protein HMPREF9569_01655 [Cutibacterium acnes HL078PA1]|nr:hypothetical protein HMPREF9569_01655 [Cutibacterium acnes HL078PA1]
MDNFGHNVPKPSRMSFVHRCPVQHILPAQKPTYTPTISGQPVLELAHVPSVGSTPIAGNWAAQGSQWKKTPLSLLGIPS